MGGKTATELTRSCRAGTEYHVGMCWDESTRPARLWLAAVRECGDAGGRLPSIGELIAFVLRPGTQVIGQTWSGGLLPLQLSGRGTRPVPRPRSAAAAERPA